MMLSEFLGRTRLSVSLSVVMAAVLTACGGGTGDDAGTATASSAAVDAAQIESVAATPSGAAAMSTEQAPAPATASPTTADAGEREHAMAAVGMIGAGQMGTMGGTGTATLSWDAPATRADGSVVGALAGYRIYYGTASGQYAGSVLVYGSTTTSGTVNGLPSGTWYFTVAAVDTVGNESAIGYELSKTL
jgi:hypothetical protein